MKKIKNSRGFSLIEMLTAMAVLVILIMGIESGMNAGMRAYRDSIFQSNSGSLSGILNTALEDVLRYSVNIRVNHDDFKNSDGDAVAKEDVPFVFTNYEYGAVDAYFYAPEASAVAAADPEGSAGRTLQLKNLKDTEVWEFINTGAYPRLGIADFEIQYSEADHYFDISYQIYDMDKPERVRNVKLAVNVLNSISASAPEGSTIPGGSSSDGSSSGGSSSDGSSSGGSSSGGTTPDGSTEECEHVFREDSNQSVAAECEKSGIKISVCSKCGAKKVEKINALGHDYTDWTVTKEPTCTETGEKERTCKREKCKHIDKEIINASGHKWSDWEVITAPTDSKKGKQQRHCLNQNCEATETRKIAVSECEHSFPDTPDKEEAPTCENPGYKLYTCSKCGYQKKDVIKASGHKWPNKPTSVDDATCTTPEISHYKCTVCGETKTEETGKALEHDYKREVTKEATCTKQGIATYTCQRKGCGDSYTEPIKALGHDLSGKVETVAPTCTEKGYTRRYCSRCETYYKDSNFVKATGHTWGDWEVTQAPTAEKEGVETKTCSVCGATETRSIPKLEESLYKKWDDSKRYKKGDIVSYDGKMYIAQAEKIFIIGKGDIYNKNKNPSAKHNAFWNVIPKWDASKVYVSNQHVVYNDKVYRAKWWTQNDKPDKAGAPWVLIK